MVALSRALRRSRLLALVLVVLTMLGSTGSWHVENDDPDCAAPVAHDHGNHHARLGHASPASAPTHCAICHWLQAFRSDAVRQARVPLVADAANAQFLTATDAIRSSDRTQLPSRAPPLSL